MSGVKNIEQMKTKGVKEISNQDLKKVRAEKGFGTSNKKSK